MRRLCFTFFLTLFAGLLAAGPATAQYSAIEVKAAFLFNFAKFTAWPDAHKPDSTGELVVGIMGKNPFGPALQKFHDTQVDGNEVRIRTVSTLEEARSCHILFIAASEENRLSRIFQELHQEGILTVSDIKGFAAGGGMIELLMIDQRIRFIVNLAAARKANLTLSSQLLNLARQVIMPQETTP
jgi:hypothetical protein